MQKYEMLDTIREECLLREESLENESLEKESSVYRDLRMKVERLMVGMVPECARNYDFMTYGGDQEFLFVEITSNNHDDDIEFDAFDYKGNSVYDTLSKKDIERIENECWSWIARSCISGEE